MRTGLWAFVSNTFLALWPMGNSCKELSLTTNEGSIDLRLIWLWATKYFVQPECMIWTYFLFTCKLSQFAFVRLIRVFSEKYFTSGSKASPQDQMHVYFKIVQHNSDTFSDVSDIHITEHVGNLGSIFRTSLTNATSSLISPAHLNVHQKIPIIRKNTFTVVMCSCQQPIHNCTQQTKNRTM